MSGSASSSPPVTGSQGKKVTLESILANLLIAGLKMVFGFAASSKALIADGLHSFADLSTDFVTYFGLEMAGRPSDSNHPYGHHRFVSLSHILMGGLLIFFCGLLIWGASSDLIEGDYQVPQWWVIPGCIVSIITKEIIYYRTLRVAKRERSRILILNAWHHRLDSVSTVLVLAISIIIFTVGPQWAFLDPVMALLVAACLGWVGFRQTLSAFFDIMDTAPSRRILDDIREHILPQEGVIGYHALRARRMGDFLEVDFHLQVDPALSVEEGHSISGRVKQEILAEHPEVIDVLIHLEPATGEQMEKETGVHGINPSQQA